MRRYARMMFENDRKSACTHLFFQHNRLLPLQFSFLGNHKRILVVIFLSFVNYRSSKKQLTKLPRRKYFRTGQNNEMIGRKEKKDKMREKRRRLKTCDRSTSKKEIPMTKLLMTNNIPLGEQLSVPMKRQFRSTN